MNEITQLRADLYILTGVVLMSFDHVAAGATAALVGILAAVLVLLRGQ